ncbi:hypothetical protein [Streptomyces sp. NRRL S-350]|uniref:hypothetical protein n=1 Tax=Streptomyces sp. NRRL S-350 TaxID=1463902 RepID=UPI0004BEEEC4|nr:hypothetical protein [Streptomyces sp. NRRL S-350]
MPHTLPMAAVAWQGVLGPLGYRAATPERPLIAPVPLGRPSPTTMWLRDMPGADDFPAGYVPDDDA